MANRVAKHTITEKDVENCDNFTELMNMTQELCLDVPEDKETIIGFKTILLSYLSANGGSGTAKPKITWDTTSVASSEDISNRTKLREFYEKTIAYIKTLPGPFQDDLNEFFPGYKHCLQVYADELKTSRCVLLVAGEKGSGKSSLVNLLLGHAILPVSELQCTATIVEIQYGPSPYAEIFYLDDSSGRAKKPLVEKASSESKTENFIKKLEYYITFRDPETDESPYEKIKIFWPLDTLKGGATIVDSPGVGDSRVLPQQLTDYMEKAVGFIYVIDSTTAIHEHRLGQLLLKASEKNNDMFDDNTAMFVCNRWDLIPPDASDRVLKFLRDRLLMILPGTKISQLFPISIKESKACMEYGQCSKEHQQLVDGIRKFLPQTMRAKLRVYYRYLSNVLKRSLYSLRLSYRTTQKSVTIMQDEAILRDKRRQMLEKKTQEKLDIMRREVKTATIQASEDLLTHLNSMYTQSRLCTWKDMELPRKDKWQRIVKTANTMILERLTVVINEWENGSKIVEKVGKNIVEEFQKQFQLFTDEVVKVEGVFLNSDDRQAMFDFKNAMQENPQKMMKAQKNKSTGFLNLGASMVSNLSLDPRDSYVRRIFKEMYVEKNNPKMAMKAATELILSFLTELYTFTCIGKFFDRFVKGIDRVGKLVPQLMKADQTLLDEISKKLNDKETKLKMFPQISKECGLLQGEVDMFYLQRLMVMEFTADNFPCTDKDKLGSGSFANVYKAKLGSDTVALKEPKDCISIKDVTDILMEETMLRQTTHRNIVNYRGAYRKGDVNKIFLNMVMDYCPYTVKDKFINSNNSPSKHGDNPIRQTEAISVMTNFLVQICEGLTYLHDKSIVHRDLKPENLLLTEDNVIKIADLGLAKKVQEIVTHGIGTPIYMAPEILLLNDDYDTKADIYSFAMINWELWYGQDLAHYAGMELRGRLQDNIQRHWRPSLTITAAPTEFWKILITVCWNQDPSKRPSIQDIGKKLREIYKVLEETRKGH